MNASSSIPGSAPATLKGVSAKKGILHFDSLEDLENAYPTIANMDSARSALWEKGIGFTSQRNIFNQIVEAEYDFLAKPYEDKSDKELKRTKAPTGHTDLYRKHLRAGVIKIQPIEGEDSYDYALSDASYAPIVNAEGFYIVGNTVYQVKNDLTKEMDGADLSKLSLLAKAALSDSANKITVRPTVEVPDAAAAQVGVLGCSFPLTSGWVTSGNRRGSTTIKFTVSYLNPFPYKKAVVAYNVSVISQKRNAFGTWLYPPCPNECWIAGTWTLSLDYMNAATLNHAFTIPYPRSFAYPHPNCINNFQASINPFTGLERPNNTTYVVTAPPGLAFQGISMQPVHWNVSVPGGSSGINCGVAC
jgi:hypothetical protein